MQAETDITAHKTLAQAARERRDVVTGQVMAEEKLVRFVAGPDGVVVPDVARKLPGRGVWVAADRASVETAAKKNLFSRSAKAKLSAPAELAELVEKLLVKRVLDGLGLARRAGDLTSGFEKVMAAVRSGKAAWLIEASDGAADGRQKILNLARHMTPQPRVVGIFTSAELGLALGGENVIHTAFLGGRSAGSWTQDVERLAGFRPLLPESWREER
ncbi:RNA-binding protein [Caulobacter sp. SLTY]|uniref:RNA-binding protein n=1 Tax=Caulobacter sp. SLTY TaxID=2683262 RepID=UPI001411DFF3|nr:RNA-binding protein [Caulobacter sp. SLTY]NBB17651.1 RNA-binding protein [Caulobacter sp. SLTY]